MLAQKLSTRDSRRGLIATATAVVFIVSGVGLIGVSIASQRRAPQPRVSESWLRPTISATRASEKPSSKVIGPTLPRSRPVNLNIPSINVHSDVQSLGQTAEGALEVPAPGPHYNEAAWYRYSPTPGSLGPTIILGHVDSAIDGPSVFFRLGELQPGDRVSITRADDSIAVFIVDEVHRYAKDNFPTDLVYGDINHAGLRILTCGGTFDGATGHYLDNIVVFGSLRVSREDNPQNRSYALGLGADVAPRASAN